MDNILYISLADWYWIKQRPHHFCESMQKFGYNIEYLCKKPCRKVGRCMETGEEITHIELNRVSVLPYESKFKIIKNINTNLMKNQVVKKCMNKKYKYILLTHPDQLKFFTEKELKENKIIYDCMDNYNELFKNPKMQQEVINLERKLVSIAHKVIVSSEKIKENFLKEYNIDENKIKVINNGVDLKNFSLDCPENNEIIQDGRKKVGYIGTVSGWFDCESLIKAAKVFKDVDFYIIGPVIQDSDIEAKSKDITNIKLTGPKDYKDIPGILKRFDVAVMPFKLNKLIESVNPVKIYEYLAMNKAVIATRYKETEKFGDLIYLYSNPDEFIECLKKALEEKEIIPERRKYALKNSWDDRVKDVLEFIKY